jgi:N-formylmaleamate deformylase
MTWTSVTVTVDGLDLHLTRAGTPGSTPVVALHGIGDDGLCWTTVAEALEDAHDLVLLDARGHGRSQAPEEPHYDPVAQAGDVVGVIEALGLEQPVLLGHSMGALTALALAGTHPALPRAIVLEDPPPMAWTRDPAAEDSEDERLRREINHAGMRAITRRTHAELVTQQRAAAPTWPEAEILRWAESKERLDADATGLLLQRLELLADWPRLLMGIRCPTLLITGDPASGALVTPEDAEVLRTHVRHVSLAHVPAAGHSIRHDRPDAYLEALRAFLAGR